ncbi:MAG TPA: hypothetical protein VKV39_18905 [Candidatus Sulfotelmatobacter sp.]|nr:hypothetical protein [Candidatus Sulfotelmatobacter sp.]
MVEDVVGEFGSAMRSSSPSQRYAMLRCYYERKCQVRTVPGGGPGGKPLGWFYFELKNATAAKVG